ncbi:hypothetical protein Pint_04185 [Pistacia integerrima]|uniref:Uncharacterized protein n=1 Tax=Pistacia integerrima TaxID=434235 RepID=A0ACC0Z514_9ROSI|nr:hypothetical protein Pint_04185 [Pistacia integerrima]
MLISVDPNLSEELQSFAHCLTVSELLGFECIERYLPHRVAMQFGMDQDLPPCGDVTSQYSKWWKQSISCLQGARDCSFTGTKKIMEMAKGKKETDTSSSFKTKPKILGGTNGKNFIKSFKITPRGFPPKPIVAETKDSAEECDMTIADFMKSSIKHDDGNNRQVPDVKHMSSQSQKISFSATGDEVVNIIDPQTELVENMMQVETEIVKVVPEALSELATDSKTSDQDHDMVRM